MSTITLTGKLGLYSFSTKSQFIEGGTGKVYKGSVVHSTSPDLRVGTSVAIKVLYRDLTANVLNIIRDENAASIRINHPNLLRMYEFIEWKRRYHLISEWLDGETLEEKLKDYVSQNDLPPQKEIGTVVHSLLNALECLHQLNPSIYHRDVKPGNLMLHNGSVKLIDFGIVKTRRNTSLNETVYGSTLGTPAYCPPEQIKGEHQLINETSDLYAVGNIVFEIFMGRKPFAGTQYEVSHKQVHESLREEDCAAIPEPYRSFVLKATQKKQEDRFQNVNEARAHLEKKIEPPPKESPPNPKKDWRQMVYYVKWYVGIFSATILLLIIISEIWIILKELLSR